MWVHRINHWLGSNTGTIVTEWRGDELWIGFKCTGCGQVNGWHKSITERRRRKNDLEICRECGINLADPPSLLCPGCEAYQEHQR